MSWGDGVPSYSDELKADLARVVAERDSLADRVRELEADKLRLMTRGLEEMAMLRERAQEVRRAWDDREAAKAAGFVPIAVSRALVAAIDRLCPPEQTNRAADAVAALRAALTEETTPP